MCACTYCLQAQEYTYSNTNAWDLLCPTASVSCACVRMTSFWMNQVELCTASFTGGKGRVK